MGSLTEEERVEETLQAVQGSGGPQREHTRCDDRISIFYTPIDETDEEFESRADSNFDGINTGSEENPQLFKLLFDIDQKLNMLLKHISDKEGFVLPEATDVNISGGGLRFASKESFAEGALLRVKTVLPNLAGTVDLKCRVVRSVLLDNGLHEVAVKYVDLDEATREVIIKYIFATQRKHLRSERSSGADF